MDKTELQTRTASGEGVYPCELDDGLLADAGMLSIVMPIPMDFDARLSMFGNLMAQMCSGMRIDDDKLRMEMRSLSAALSYLINSSSYMDKELHDYDARALVNKLGRKAKP